jgi:hypothetical protein
LIWSSILIDLTSIVNPSLTSIGTWGGTRVESISAFHSIDTWNTSCILTICWGKASW